MHVRSDRRHQFAAARLEVWEAMADVESYRRWWPWLRTFDAAALEVGDRWRCSVKSPLPYTLRFVVAIDEVTEGRSVSATISGDLEGSAELELYDHLRGCEVRLTSVLSPANKMLRAVAQVAEPLVHFGHDWVLDTGARQFADRALK